MRLRLRSITYLAEDINGYELVDPNGRDLPRFDAGAHIGVRLGDDLWRDYSLWNDPAERRRYCIAVLRETLGEASRRLHDEIRVGDTVEVSPPRNHFPLADGAERHLLLAGGIGITPIMAMIRHCEAEGRPEKKLSPEAIELLQGYPWPGNVRELRNLMERAAVMVDGDNVGAEDLVLWLEAPRGGEDSVGLRGEIERREADAVRKALEAAGGNVTQAAAALGIDRTNLHRKMRKYGIQRR